MEWKDAFSGSGSGSGMRIRDGRRFNERDFSDGAEESFLPRSEIPSNSSPDQLLALFVALAASINSSPSIRDNNALENLVNKDVGFSNLHTNLIGNGSSFTVRVWHLEAPEQSLVFKSVLPSDYKFTDKDEKRRLEDVILELRALSHPALANRENVVKLLGLGWETDSFERKRKWPVLILEYADGGTLNDFLSKNQVTPQAKLSICQDIACGLVALHDVGVIHGDVKPANILMFRLSPSTSNRPWIAKLSDFGGAALDMSGDGMDILRTGTQPWNAPEWRTPMRPESMMKQDVYSFGLVAFSIAINGADPFGIFPFPPDCVGIQQRNACIQSWKEENSYVLTRLVNATRQHGAQEIDGYLLELLLKSTIQYDPLLRSLEDAIEILEAETGRAKSEMDLKSWQRNPKSLQEELAGANELDTLDPEVRKYVKLRLEDTFERNDELWQRTSSAFNLGIESLSDTNPATASKECIRWLREAAELGSQSAQSIVYRFTLTLNPTEPIKDLDKIKNWAMDAAMRGFPAAQEDLHLVASPEECRQVKEKLRRRYAGIGHNRFAFLYADLNKSFDEWDVGLAKILQERFELHEEPEWFTLGMARGDNILHFVASAGLLETINLWRYPRLIDINCKGDEGETPLLHAARSGHFEATLAILKVGGDPIIASENGDTPLHWILSYDPEHMKHIAAEFCSRGADVNARAKAVFLHFAPECNYEAGTPLHRAVGRGNLDAVRTLLSVGARADDEGDRRYTPINLAASLHYPEILDILLESLQVPDPAGRVYAGMSLLAPAVGGENFHGEKFSKVARHGPTWFEKGIQTLNILLDSGANKHVHGLPEESIGAGVNSLFLATTQGDSRTVEYFLEHGSLSDLNVPSQYEATATPRTPLIRAIASRRDDTALVLLRYGADPLALHIDENGDGLSTLYECSSAGHSATAIAEKLVAAGVPLDGSGPPSYETPFACAIRNRSFTLASWLLQKGANPNVEYSKGFMFESTYPSTLLGILVLEQSLSTLACLDFLLENVPSLSFTAASSQGFTVLHAVSLIKEYGRDDIAVHLMLLRLREFFKPTTEQVNQVCVAGYTALHLAVLRANPDLVRRLLKMGADPNAKDSNDRSSIDASRAACQDIDEHPDEYVDERSTKPREEQIRLAKMRRQDIRELFEELESSMGDVSESGQS